MRIGICGPFNPYVIRSYFEYAEEVPQKSQTAMAVNTYVCELLEKGHRVVIFTVSNTAKSFHLAGKNVDVYMISDKPPFFPKGRMFGFLYMPYRIAHVIKNHLHEIDVLHAQWTYAPALGASFFANKLPVFCTVRDWCPYIQSLQTSYRGKAFWKKNRYIFNRLMKSDHVHFVANSLYTHSKIREAYPEKEVPVIPNPIKKELILDKPNRQRIPHRFISIATSLADPRKNVTNLLRAFVIYKNEYKDSQLILIGDPKGIQNYWEKEGLLGNVNLVGSQPHEKVMSLIKQSSCLIHPSHEETFGNILLEAMAQWVLCIGGKESGAVPYVLGGGKYGLLCDVSDYHSIYMAMKEANEESLIHNITKAAHDMLYSTYSSDIIVDRHIKMYQLFMAQKELEADV